MASAITVGEVHGSIGGKNLLVQRGPNIIALQRQAFRSLTKQHTNNHQHWWDPNKARRHKPM